MRISFEQDLDVTRVEIELVDYGRVCSNLLEVDLLPEVRMRRLLCKWKDDELSRRTEISADEVIELLLVRGTCGIIDI